MKTSKHYLLFFIFFVTLISCSDSDDGQPAIQKLESATEVFPRSKTEIESLVDLAGLSDLKQYLEYDISIYEITYKTTFKGEEIIASGLLTFPETDQAVPMMSFQHGTMVGHDEAPTQDKSTYTFLSSVASAGYILLIPDFIGFGSSDNILHPYYHKESTANSVTDMLIAAKELAVQEGYSFNGDVFLSGYSEGGYATMAAHQSLEENPIDGLNLVASAPSSGGYDVKGMQEYFFSLTTYDQPFYLAFVALSYESVYDWTISLSDLFQEPYATALPGYFDGSLNGSQINDRLTTTVSDFLSPDFLSGVDTENKYAELVDAFEENSLDNWVPTVRMFMYHGTDDITVPYQNSVDSYNKMKSLGASSEIVSFTDLEGHTHGSGFFPYLYDCLDNFDKLK